jgi:hypothetical protein
MAAHIQVVAQYSDFWDQYSSYMTGLVRIGEIEVTSVTDMVNKIIAKLSKDNAKMALMEIFAHGSAQHISIGDDDAIHAFTPKRHMPTLVRLKTYFTRLLQDYKTSKISGFLSGRGQTLPLPWLGISPARSIQSLEKQRGGSSIRKHGDQGFDHL